MSDLHLTGDATDVTDKLGRKGVRTYSSRSDKVFCRGHIEPKKSVSFQPRSRWSEREGRGGRAEELRGVVARGGVAGVLREPGLLAQLQIFFLECLAPKKKTKQ